MIQHINHHLIIHIIWISLQKNRNNKHAGISKTRGISSRSLGYTIGELVEIAVGLHSKGEVALSQLQNRELSGFIVCLDTQWSIHFQNQDVICPEYKCDINYNEQFWKKYLKNQINFALIKDISEKIGDLEKQVKEVQVKYIKYRPLARNIKNFIELKIVRKIADWLCKFRKVITVLIKTVIECMALMFLSIYI